MHAMITSQACYFFHFLMTTLFNTVKLGQHDQFHPDNSLRTSDLRLILHASPTDIHLSEITPGAELIAIVKTISEITSTFFGMYSEVFELPLDKKIEGKPPLQKTYKFLSKTIF